MLSLSIGLFLASFFNLNLPISIHLSAAPKGHLPHLHSVHPAFLFPLCMAGWALASLALSGWLSPLFSLPAIPIYPFLCLAIGHLAFY